jgi:hypothetical protein
LPVEICRCRPRGILAHFAPDISLVDELIADRRAEARAEAEAALLTSVGEG